MERRRQSSPVPAQQPAVYRWQQGGCARGTGKAGENGQHSGVVGGSSPWTGLSAPGCGDTSKALASLGSILGGDQCNLAPASLSTGSPADRAPLLLRRRDGSMYRQAHVRAEVMEKPCLVRAQPSVIVATEKASAGRGWARYW